MKLLGRVAIGGAVLAIAAVGIAAWPVAVAYRENHRAKTRHQERRT